MPGDVLLQKRLAQSKVPVRAGLENLVVRAAILKEARKIEIARRSRLKSLKKTAP